MRREQSALLFEMPWKALLLPENRVGLFCLAAGSVSKSCRLTVDRAGEKSLRYDETASGRTLGFVDGPNLYTYVRQNPWTSFDPRANRHGSSEGAAQGIANGPSISPTEQFGWQILRQSLSYRRFSLHSQFNNIGNATDKNDFIAGQNGGSIFIAAPPPCSEVRGRRWESYRRGGEKLLQAARKTQQKQLELKYGGT